ncbi:MAG: RluA family pseudouridine synthase [Gammaproteobacteria bacterium]|nr:RluA family pseudouridine synthase [Gammaproteobacteria bacterium]
MNAARSDGEFGTQYSPSSTVSESAAVTRVAVAAHHHGLRLDAVAARLFTGYSRQRLKAWIEQGRLRVNGVVAMRPRQPVAAGDRLELRAPPPDLEPVSQAQQIDIQAVGGDEHLAVIDKPAGLTVHPGAGRPAGTLVNALLHRYPQTAALPRAGLIHRLDKDTSGLLVVALNLPAYTRLTRMMAARAIHREYDALVHGEVIAGGRIEAPIGRDSHSRVRMAVVARGRPAVTHYRVVERFGGASWLRVRLETGRTHQIRVHMAHIRHPLLGDPIYGGRRCAGADAGFKRQALHARLLAFEHPITARKLAFESPLPADLDALIGKLRSAMHG